MLRETENLMAESPIAFGLETHSNRPAGSAFRLRVVQPGAARERRIMPTRNISKEIIAALELLSERSQSA